MSLNPHYINTLVWNIHNHCPAWRMQWQRALTTLYKKRCHFYRHFDVTLVKNSVIVSTSYDQHIFLSKLNEKELFFICHRDIVDLFGTFMRMTKNGTSSSLIERVLINQWPTDRMWVNAIRQLVQSTYYNPSARYLPRLLAERKKALVLERTDDTWVSTKGLSLDKLFKKSDGIQRRAFELLLSLPMLCKIEIPFALDYEQFLPILQTIHQSIQAHPEMFTNTTPWQLSFRRIQGMGLNGCFDAASQTIIIDPRALHTLTHEFCHWLLGHGIHTARDIHIQEQQVDTLLQTVFKQPIPTNEG